MKVTKLNFSYKIINMSTILKVNYYNTFWNKRIVTTAGTGADELAFWPGLSWNPAGYPTYPNGVTIGANELERRQDWFIEESRIVGGYNNNYVTYGVKAYLNEDNITQEHRFNSLIYSGIFNSRTGVNRTNVFSVADNITKSADPSYGSIQRTYADDNDLIILQENKVSRALIDKDALYTAEGSANITSTDLVVGQIVPYVGDFGIADNPESFARFGFRRYFSDIYTGSVLRLSRDGLTEISKNGMTDFFRDELKKISSSLKLYTVNNTTVTNGTVNSLVVLSDSKDIEIGMNIEVDNLSSSTYVTDVSYTSSVNNEVGNLTNSISLNPTGITVDQVYTNLTTTVSPIGATGLILNAKVVGGTVIDVKSIIGGSGYNVGDVVSVSAAQLPGASSDLEITITAADVYVVTLSNSVTLSTGTNNLRFTKNVKDKVVGGWDIVDRQYVISLQITATSPGVETTYYTLTFDEDVRGWNSFYTYAPSAIISLKDTYYTTSSISGSTLWKHYSEDVINNRGNFYGLYSDSYVDFIFNEKPSNKKVFQTISYEGDNGFKIDYFKSDFQQTDPNIPSETPVSYSQGNTYQDTTSQIYSYDEGVYTQNGYTKRAGFDRKENLYVANLVNDSSVRPNEIIFGNKMSGIKGYFARVKISTDGTTQKGGLKEIWSVGTKYVQSS